MMAAMKNVRSPISQTRIITRLCVSGRQRCGGRLEGQRIFRRSRRSKRYRAMVGCRPRPQGSLTWMNELPRASLSDTPSHLAIPSPGSTAIFVSLPVLTLLYYITGASPYRAAGQLTFRVHRTGSGPARIPLACRPGRIGTPIPVSRPIGKRPVSRFPIPGHSGNPPKKRSGKRGIRFPIPE